MMDITKLYSCRLCNKKPVLYYKTPGGAILLRHNDGSCPAIGGAGITISEWQKLMKPDQSIYPKDSVVVPGDPCMTHVAFALGQCKKDGVFVNEHTLKACYYAMLHTRPDEYK